MLREEQDLAEDINVGASTSTANIETETMVMPVVSYFINTVLPRSNLTENRGQPRANRGLTAVRPRARRGRHEGGSRANRGSLTGQPQFARVPPSCRPRAALCY